MTSDSNAAANSEVSAHTDILIPINPDKTAIKCENNRACIDGALHEVAHTGKTVFDSVQSFNFYAGLVADSTSAVVRLGDKERTP